MLKSSRFFACGEHLLGHIAYNHGFKPGPSSFQNLLWNWHLPFIASRSFCVLKSSKFFACGGHLLVTGPYNLQSFTSTPVFEFSSKPSLILVTVSHIGLHYQIVSRLFYVQKSSKFFACGEQLLMTIILNYINLIFLCDVCIISSYRRYNKC